MRIVNIRLTGEKTMNNKTLKPARYLAVPLAAISIIISGCSGSNETVKNNEEQLKTEKLLLQKAQITIPFLAITILEIIYMEETRLY